MDGVRPDGRQARLELELDLVAIEDAGEPVNDRLDEVLDVEDLEARTERAGLDPAHVEQVADEAVEALGLEVDRPGRGATLVVGPGDLGIHQAAGRGADRGERRAQVVRHRIEERVLEGLALPGDLGGGSPPRRASRA